jgi:hypothetical protein
MSLTVRTVSGELLCEGEDPLEPLPDLGLGAERHDADTVHKPDARVDLGLDLALLEGLLVRRR